MSLTMGEPMKLEMAERATTIFGMPEENGFHISAEVSSTISMRSAPWHRPAIKQVAANTEKKPRGMVEILARTLRFPCVKMRPFPFPFPSLSPMKGAATVL